jgi:hypothetical protein
MFNDYAIPRPEYPRPDRQRGRVEGVDWLNLNGPWQFRFDLNREGEERHWQAPDGEDWPGQIVVPFCWESLAAWGEGDAAGNDNYYSSRAYLNPVEVTRENHRSAKRYEVGWYRREIRVPVDGAWHGKRVILTIGAADFFTDCWCNGVHLGRNEGGYLPFEFDLTDALTQADRRGQRSATLVIRVEDPMDNHEQPVGKQWAWYTTTSGIWQTVFIEPRAMMHIESFRIFPDIDAGTVAFEVHCEGAVEGAQVSVKITPPEAPAFTTGLDLQGALATGGAEIHPVSLWEPGHPHLYRVTFRMTDPTGTRVDEVLSYFGMRKISTTPAGEVDGPAMLCLNNKAIYLRGALYQSYHPDGVYTAREAQTLKNDIQFALSAGFDFLRIHIKLDDPLVLFYADTLGILLMQDFPNFGEGGDTPLGRRRFEEMMRAGFKRDFNHPSIISWCIFNETWGFGGQAELIKVITPNAFSDTILEQAAKIANSSSFKWVHEMWTLAKSLDPTRLIEDMSVVAWEHLVAYGHVDTDINSWHFYIDNYTSAKAHIDNVVAKTYHGSTFNYVEGYAQRNVPLINSEYGGVGALDGDRDVSWSFKFLTNELRIHGQLSAYIFTQLMDVEWEYNGLLNYDRTPKEFGYPLSIINHGDVLPINAPPIQRLATGGSVEVDVLSSHFSRRRRDQITFHWRYSGINSLGQRDLSLDRGYARIAFPHRRVELARRLELELPKEAMLCTLWVSAVTADGNTVASNFVQHFVSDGPPPERERRGQRLILRRRIHEWADAEWSDGQCSREEAIQRGYCFGSGPGFFEWTFSDEELHRLEKARRVDVLMEASARRNDVPQTDAYRHSSRFELSVNGLPILRTLLPDHPHDTRGALSYLRGDRGAYGYLLSAEIGNGVITSLAERVRSDGALRVRCDAAAVPYGGLTLYDYDCGRFPICPTVIIDWGE